MQLRGRTARRCGDLAPGGRWRWLLYLPSGSRGSETEALRRQKAFDGLGRIQSGDAIALWNLSINEQVLRPIRDQARAMLLGRYRPSWMLGGSAVRKNDAVGGRHWWARPSLVVCCCHSVERGSVGGGREYGSGGGAAIGAGTASLYCVQHGDPWGGGTVCRLYCGESRLRG